jgi:hypothetical protein
MPRDWYETLGVKREATDKETTTAALLCPALRRDSDTARRKDPHSR